MTMRPLIVVMFCAAAAGQPAPGGGIGREVAVPVHLTDGQEFELSVTDLVAHGRMLFTANWTSAEGGGRPRTKGTGKELADLASPLKGRRGMNRISGPDANSCAGCHNLPFGIPGGGGDFVTGVFVLGQRFDFATLDRTDRTPSRGAVDETGADVTLQTIGNYRATTGMHGAGYLELLARQITADLQAIRDRIPPGGSAELRSSGIGYGVLARDPGGAWITSGVEGIAVGSLVTAGPTMPPSLVIRPWHQAGAVVSLREFTNNAFNHHHGIQSTERFGVDVDADGDGFGNELTRADVTAATLFQAAMAPPGRVIPRIPEVEAAVLRGERVFESIGCASCHLPKLLLRSARFTEPGPYNPAGNLRQGEAETLTLDLSSLALPGPRLPQTAQGIEVPAFTDFKIHLLCDGPDDENFEPLNMHHAAGTAGFAEGNGRFLTYRLWDSANQPPYGHHGRFSTMREAVESHGGEAAPVREAWRRLPAADRDAVIEFLKTLQVLPPGVAVRVVDERYQPREWPARGPVQ
ncbi:MAG: di-heme oxidoredictase family protein [Bryobacteraceae bacterium]|nr:di-heme oxidoredictase family protein [Bryobacteraceae bacterium]